MTDSRKIKVSVTLSADLVAKLDRHAERGETRSGVMERWLRRAALLEVEKEIEDATVAYYDGLTSAERAEDEALARSLSRKARKLEIDGPRPKRG